MLNRWMVLGTASIVALIFFGLIYEKSGFADPLGDLMNIGDAMRSDTAYKSGQSDTAQDAPTLILALKDNDSLVRSSAAESLGKLGDTKAVEPLIRALKDNNSTVRLNSAWALGCLNDTAALNPLILALNDTDAYVRACTAQSLGNFRDNRATIPLIITLRDNSSKVRLKSAEALGKINDKRATGPLIQALNDTDSAVRSEAMKSLVDWVKVFGGPKDDVIVAGYEAGDGGYVLVGSTYSYGAGDRDVWLLRTDNNGTELWNKTFGGSGWDNGADVLGTEDGGFIIIGETESFGSGDKDLWLIKAGSEGNEEWNRTFGGSGEDLSTSLKRAKDGGYIIAGITGSYGSGGRDLWLLRIDSKGGEIWNRTFGGEGRDEGFAVLNRGDGYFVAGYTDSNKLGPGSLWLVKTDLKGKELWNRTFGLSDSGEDVAFSADLTDDGGYIISGGRDGHPWLIKTGSSGIEEWNRTLELDRWGERSPGLSIIQTEDGRFLLGGYTCYSQEYRNLGWFFNSRAFVAMADPRGSWIWSTIMEINVLDEGGSQSSMINQINETSDGGILLVGGSEEIGPSIYSDFSDERRFRPDYRGWDAWLIKLKSGDYSSSTIWGSKNRSSHILS